MLHYIFDKRQKVATSFRFDVSSIQRRSMNFGDKNKTEDDTLEEERICNLLIFLHNYKKQKMHFFIFFFFFRESNRIGLGCTPLHSGFRRPTGSDNRHWRNLLRPETNIIKQIILLYYLNLNLNYFTLSTNSVTSVVR